MHGVPVQPIVHTLSRYPTVYLIRVIRHDITAAIHNCKILANRRSGAAKPCG